MSFRLLIPLYWFLYTRFLLSLITFSWRSSSNFVIFQGMADLAEEPGPFLDRDAETVRWMTVATPDEAKQLLEQVQEPITWLEAPNAAQLFLDNVLDEQAGQTSIMIFLSVFNEAERENLIGMLDALLSRLWSHSKKLYIVRLA